MINWRLTRTTALREAANLKERARILKERGYATPKALQALDAAAAEMETVAEAIDRYFRHRERLRFLVLDADEEEATAAGG